MSLFETEKALQKALKNVTNIPDIAWPNIRFEPTIGEPFVRPTLLPAAPEVCTLNNYNKHSGIYQIDIYVPNNVGIKELYTIADNIKNYYRSNKTLTSNGVTVFIKAIDVGRSERQDAWFTTFLEIQYLSFN